ncbi:hypothetical protein CEXT_565461 [Caerostris extrusa]|uniref:Uncharacterized protein n=1 Tax=Caerostris extrusa TaxID=172846 RepID=A0AAV4QY04_CAEEX|nr:hypothetical protein CEXT_565461 [Caerostris extrusa]
MADMGEWRDSTWEAMQIKKTRPRATLRHRSRKSILTFTNRTEGEKNLVSTKIFIQNEIPRKCCEKVRSGRKPFIFATHRHPHPPVYVVFLERNSCAVRCLSYLRTPFILLTPSSP